jgi:transcriptional regulator with XRE-family HTH domain
VATRDEVLIQNRVRAWLRWALFEYGINQTELARRIGSDQGNLTRYLQGERHIATLAQTLRICRGIHLTPSRLLGENPAVRHFGTDEVPPAF